MITILHIRNSNYPGGIETTLLGWFKFIDRSRFNPRLLVFKERFGYEERSVQLMQEQGLESEMIPWGHTRNLIGAVLRLIGTIRSEENVILHSHDTRSDLVSIIAAKFTGVPVIISNHAWHPADFKRRVLEYIRSRIMRFSDLIISVSKETHQETLHRGLSESRCISLYSGIDLEPFKDRPSQQEARSALGLGNDDFVIGNVARLWPEKEQDKIIEAAGRLTVRYPKAKFLIVGDGPLRESLVEQIKKLGLEKTVLLPGYRKDLTNVLSALDVFVFPSSAEGTPMVIYAAMAMGLPIIASPVSGVGEVLIDDSCAMFVPPADAEALAVALEKLIEDSDLGKRLGESAKSVVEEKYSVEQAVKQLEQVYLKFVTRENGIQQNAS